MNQVKRIKFYVLRVKNSSIKEITYRIKELVFIKKIKTTKGQILQTHINFVRDIKIPHFYLSQNSYKFVKELLNGKVYILNDSIEAINKVEAWYRSTFFSDIDIAKLPLDIRSIWEPARLQHLAFLSLYILQNPTLANKEIIKEYIKKSLFKWFKNSPFPYGLHYISAMECALRIPVFVYCFKTLEDILTKNELEKIAQQIFINAWFVFNRLSLYSSLGNHTIAECTGLIFAALSIDCSFSKKWLDVAIQLLKQEAYHQILDDGGPAEQSLNYHRFVLDLLWLSKNMLEINGNNELKEVEYRLKKGENFLSCFYYNKGEYPSIGDSDDAHAIAPGVSPVIRNREQNLGYYLFQTSGYSVIRTKDLLFIFDHGPLGMPPLYNHGHADALSVILIKKEIPFLIDTGTYKYNKELGLRRYFKGTKAHNTVTIDDKDQAVQETSFIWSHPYRCHLEKFCLTEKDLYISAYHDGYKRLSNPVFHRRTVSFFDNEFFIIKDSFWGEGSHKFELNFHIAPGANVNKIDNKWWQIENKKESIFICSSDEHDFFLTKNFYSPCYGVKSEINVLHMKKHGQPKEVCFYTVISIKSSLDLKVLEEKVKKSAEIENTQYMGR